MLPADSIISDIQRDHLESIEKLVPDLASLRARLCPSYMDEDVFWKIYFKLLELNINEHSSEVSWYMRSIYCSLLAYFQLYCTFSMLILVISISGFELR